tara:strand:+ start:319 stop:633 length:315 start_codon:yes stop_codon:yes gene_type:complete
MSISLEAKVDLMLALLQEQSTKVNTLVKKYGLISETPKWVTCGELAEITNTKSGTITNWIYKGKIPQSILKKKTRGKVYNWLIDSTEGQKVIEAIRLGIDYKEG